MRAPALLAAALLAGASAPALAQDWNSHFGGIPGDNMITAEIGYSAVPKVGFHHPIAPDVTLGGAVGFDLGYYSPRGGTNFGLQLSAPIRIAISNGGQWSTGLKLEPGFLFQFEGAFGFNLLLNGGFNAGYRVNNQFIIGPGVDVLLGFRLTNGFAFYLPILIGGALEFHARPDLALTFDLKFGPFIVANEFASDAVFGLKVAAGIAYKF